MSAVTFTIEDPTEALLAQKAIAFARQLKKTADLAPDGQVIRLTERCAIDDGLQFLRDAMTIAMQTQAEAVEKKGPLSAPVPVATAATTAASPDSNS